MTDQQAVYKALGELVLAYPRQEIPPGTLAKYAQRLEMVPIDALARLIDELIDTQTWFPSVAEIKDAWFDDIWSEALGPADSLAWCIREINRIGDGNYDSRSGLVNMPDEFPDLLTAKTVEIFGWGRLHRSSGDDWLRKDWDKAYQNARSQIKRQFVTGELVALQPAPARQQTSSMKAVGEVVAR